MTIGAVTCGAAVDTLSFAPLVTADSTAEIVTDWYVNPSTPVSGSADRVDHRPDLRADALRVAASRQVNQNGVGRRRSPPPSRSLRTSSSPAPATFAAPPSAGKAIGNE
jgi:hypothetical protein